MSLWPIKLGKYRYAVPLTAFAEASDQRTSAIVRSACPIHWAINSGLRTASRMGSLLQVHPCIPPGLYLTTFCPVSHTCSYHRVQGRDSPARRQGMASQRALPPGPGQDRVSRWRRSQALQTYRQVRLIHTSPSKTRLSSARTRSLVVELGLRSTLSEYKVPREDLPKIAELALGSRDDPTYPRVIQLLEGIY